MRRLKELDPMRKELGEYLEKTAEGMNQSALVVSIFTDNYKESLDGLLQFILAMMLDKPLFLLVPEGTKIPAKVRLVCDGIEFFKKGDMDSVKKASDKLLRSAIEKGLTA